MVPRIVLAGAGSGVGKTTIAAGLMRRLSRDHVVQGFKVGPDYMDPKFHQAATGRPSRNLDSFMLKPSMMQNLFGWSTHDADIAVVEGVRGLYDGLTAIGDIGSTAEIAKMLDAPVILIVNARSLAKSAAAVVLGFRMLDPSVRIAGVILNHISGPRHLTKATEAVESLAGVEVLGNIHRSGEGLPERHLGLVASETSMRESLDVLERMVEEVDMDRVMEIASSAGDIDLPTSSPFPEHEPTGVRIAVPYDRAYCMYYPENLEALAAAGAEVVRFRPSEGEGLPDCDGAYLGGGYPELHASSISDNHDFLEGIQSLSSNGGAIYGECGGLLTLCSSLRVDREDHPMARVFGAVAEFTGVRHGPSYVRATGTLENPFLPGQKVRGHEFHYSEIRPLPGHRYGFRVERGSGIEGGMDGMVRDRSIGTYMHLHALSCPQWAPALVEAAGLRTCGR